MSVAPVHVFAKDHIARHAFHAPLELAEQAVHCLELVAELSRAGLSFQFKGGNSLLLILAEPLRFSIDVDIATDEKRERIEECLDAIIMEHGVFTTWERRQHKTKPWLPITSYYLFYHSQFSPSEDTSIMFDVQLRRSPYRTEMKPVVCGGLYISEALTELPLPASIIGDKLLTLGPYTLGIPIGKGKEAQRIKHAFDVSTLLPTGPLLSGIRESFDGCLEHENELQKRALPAGDVMLDTVRYCATVARATAPPAVGVDTSPALRENVAGLAPFANHLFARGYDWAALQLDTARVAVAISAVCRGTVTEKAFGDALRGVDAPVGPEPVGLACGDEPRRLWRWVAAWLETDPLEIP